MEVYLTRTEIRALMRSLMGQSQNELVSGISLNQNNAFINAGALKVFQDCKWLSSEVRVTVDVGDGQYKVAYPADMAVGSLKEMAICDPTDGIYSPIDLKDIPVHLDTDQLELLGGDDFDAVKGTPIYGQQRGDGIYLYPPNDDTPRKLRIRGNVRKLFLTDGQVSTCDAEAIAYWAVAMAYGDEDPAQRTFYQGMYADRVSALKANQSTGEVVSFRSDSPEMGDLLITRPTPNWDTRPRAYLP